MRSRPALHPVARLVGTAPRYDGRWVSVWTDDAVVCVTVGLDPGDASTAQRGSVHANKVEARAAATRRLWSLWDAYLAEKIARRYGWATRRSPLSGRSARSLG
jgi:hypothetical protein